MIKFFLFLLVSASLSNSALSATNAVQEFRERTKNQILTCRETEDAAFTKLAKGSKNPKALKDEVANCITEGKAAARSAFPDALSLVKENPAAANFLKDYYAAWISAIDGVMPASGDIDERYAPRQDALRSKYEEIWTRFELEVGN